MDNIETRIYLFTGFLESGKTTFANDTIVNTNFCDGEQTVMIITEEGEKEFDKNELKKHHTDLLLVETIQELTQEAFWKELKEDYHPTQVLVEFNGMWDVATFMSTVFPQGWDIVQILTTIDASKFAYYVNNANMRSYLFQHCSQSDLIVFNRIENIKKTFMRNNIKAMNPRAQIIYENADGSVDNSVDSGLPYDINAASIDVADHDFGIFCYDMMEHPENYNHKHIRIKGKFIGKDSLRKDGCILGRYAMVCCEQDTSLIGLLCQNPASNQFIPNEWLIVEGDTTMDYDKDIGMNVITLHADKIEGTTPLAYEYVTFD